MRGAGGSLKERRVSGSTWEHTGEIHHRAGGEVVKASSAINV